MSEWEIKQLHELTEFIGRGISPKYCKENGLLVINQKCIRNGRVDQTFSKLHNSVLKVVSDKKLLRLNDTLVNSTGVGTLGRVGLFRSTDTATVDSHVTIVRAGVLIDRVFLFYNLYWRQDEIESMGEGSTGQTELSRHRLGNLNIKLPKKEQQQAIAEVLSSIDDKIDLLNRQNETLEAMAQTLFRQWFIEEADDSWEEVKLSSIVQIRYGKNLPTKNMTDSGYPVCGANGIIGFYSKYNYEYKQVLVSCRGEASGKVNFSPPKSYVTNNSLVLERISTVVSFEFLKYQALNFEFKSFVTGSAQPQITIKNLELATITLPPSNLIENYSVLVRSFESKMDQNLKSVQILIKTRDTLLPKLMSGEVRVKLD
jgi:type I restriction enzyme S subunit